MLILPGDVLQLHDLSASDLEAAVIPEITMNTLLSGAASRDHPSPAGPSGAEQCYSKLPEKNTNR